MYHEWIWLTLQYAYLLAGEKIAGLKDRIDSLPRRQYVSAGRCLACAAGQSAGETRQGISCLTRFRMIRNL